MGIFLNVPWRLLLVSVIMASVFVKESFAGVGFGPCNQWFDYVQTRPHCNIFVWLVQCNNKNIYDYNTAITKPLMVHVGGPEMSASGFGFFYGTGPMNDKNLTRLFPITERFNVLYIDVPVGIGFSYCDDKSECYSSKSSEIAADVVNAVTHTLNIQTHLKDSTILFYAESVACKYTVEATYNLNKMNKESNLGLNIVGVILASPWINPFKMISYWPQYAHATGLIDLTSRDELQSLVDNKMKKLIQGGNNRGLEATKMFKTFQQTCSKTTDGINECNIMVTSCGSAFTRRVAEMNFEPPEYIMSLLNCGVWEQKLSSYMNDNVKPRLGAVVPPHVVWNHNEKKAIRYLTEEFMSDASEKFVNSLLSETQLLLVFINGQVDMVTNSLGVTEWLETIMKSGPGEGHKTNQISFTSSHRPCEGIIGYYSRFHQMYHFRLLYTGHLISKENHKGLRSILDIVMNL